MQSIVFSRKGKSSGHGIDVDALAEKVAKSLLPAVQALAAPCFERAALIEELKRKEALRDDEVELVYGYKAGTLKQWRHLKKGPLYSKEGGVILYRQKDLQAFQESRLQLTTEARSRGRHDR